MMHNIIKLLCEILLIFLIISCSYFAPNQDISEENKALLRLTYPIGSAQEIAIKASSLWGLGMDTYSIPGRVLNAKNLIYFSYGGCGDLIGFDLSVCESTVVNPTYIGACDNERSGQYIVKTFIVIRVDRIRGGVLFADRSLLQGIPTRKAIGRELIKALAHEIGHCIGLNHSSNPGSIMYEETIPGLVAISSQDIANARNLYSDPVEFEQRDSYRYYMPGVPYRQHSIPSFGVVINDEMKSILDSYEYD